MDYINDSGILVLESSEDIQVPSRSPRRPRASLVEFDLLQLCFSTFKHEFPEPDDDVSSAEYRLCGSDSPSSSIFSTSSSILPHMPDELELDELMDELELDDFDNAEICTITNVVTYNYCDKTQVHLIST